jgi:xanthine dehydrogenase FAD-binding subunit
MFDITKYLKADTVKDAVRLLSENPEAKLIAGGTDVLIKLREGHSEYSSLVDIHHVEEIRKCSLLADGTVSIGAGMCFTSVMEHLVVCEKVPVVALAAGTVGGPQVRNVATIGGNLCNGAVSADSLAALCVLDAMLVIEGTDGVWEIPVTEFYEAPGKVVLRHAEVLRCINIKKENYEGFGTHYYKYAMRNSMDIATIGCAAAVKLDGDKIDTLKLAFTVAAPKPTRAKTAENYAKGKPLTAETIDKIAETVMEDLAPRDSWRASKEFRTHIIKTLAGRVTLQAVANAGGSI